MSRELAAAAADLHTVVLYYHAGVATLAHLQRAQDIYAAACRRFVS